MPDTKHKFAFYYPELYNTVGSCQQGCEFTITDQQLYHRMISIVRFSLGDHCILFDRSYSAHIEILALEKKGIRCRVNTWENNIVLAPYITVFLSVLKKEALEEAVYSCVELGANHIQLISAQKSHRSLSGQHELERLHKIVIAAAEQSKHFSFPSIAKPISLSQALEEYAQSTMFIALAMNGKKAVSCIQEHDKQRYSSIALMIGPEGDFTDQEKELYTDKNAYALTLTPTVLRSQQAVAVGLGLLRSLL
jgi:16S rRNA (uracil1498-N3)-methyltransferase